MSDHPHVVMLAGPNGSGKSTAAAALLEGALGVKEFVNADVIARGLSAFDPDRVAVAAGRIMLQRLRELAREGASFAFETTLASRSFAPWIVNLEEQGYKFHLVFLWLPSADAAVARVAERVRAGGHAVDEATVRRRYKRGLKNFFNLYCPLATTWQVYDNSDQAGPRLVASGQGSMIGDIADEVVWTRIQEGRGHEF